MTTNKTNAGILLLAILACLFMGCAATPMQFKPDIAEPQLIVDPPSIRLGIARLLNDTRLVFQGQGFHPGDSVFVALVGVKKGDETVNIPIAEAVVGADGGFTAEVAKLVKITEILRADTELNEQMEMYVVVSQPPIPAGTYTVRAESMESDKKAECLLVVQDPSLGDGFKDWLGGLLGKIKKK
ncbi:MAG: hypothetical protein ACOZF0_09015 [Thermodesulfobacteriota bacterium]